jgi:hypothetical protein
LNIIDEIGVFSDVRCTPNISSPLPPPPPSHETTKPTPPIESAQNNHAKEEAQIDMLVDADKSANDISKKAACTSGPSTSIIAPGETLY